MRFFALAASALLANTVLAAPSVESRTSVLTVHVQWQGAADAIQDQWVPVDGTKHDVNARFSVSHIALLDTIPSVQCEAFGVDQSDTVVHGSQPVDVGPPQVQKYVVCTIGPK